MLQATFTDDVLERRQTARRLLMNTIAVRYVNVSFASCSSDLIFIRCSLTTIVFITITAP